MVVLLPQLSCWLYGQPATVPGCSRFICCLCLQFGFGVARLNWIKCAQTVGAVPKPPFQISHGSMEGLLICSFRTLYWYLTQQRAWSPWILVKKFFPSGQGQQPLLPCPWLALTLEAERKEKGRGNAELDWGSLIACCCPQGLGLALFLLFLCCACCLTRWLLHKHSQTSASNSLLGCSFSP